MCHVKKSNETSKPQCCCDFAQLLLYDIVWLQTTHNLRECWSKSRRRRRDGGSAAAAPPTTYQVQPWHYKTQRGFRIGKGGRRPFSSTFYCTFTKQINKKWIFFEFKKRLWPDVILFVAVDVPFFLCIISESNKKEGVPCMSTAWNIQSHYILSPELRWAISITAMNELSL